MVWDDFGSSMFAYGSRDSGTPSVRNADKTPPLLRDIAVGAPGRASCLTLRHE